MFFFCTKVSFLCNEYASGAWANDEEKSFRYPEIIRLEIIHPEIIRPEIIHLEIIRLEVIRLEIIRLEIIHLEVIRPEIIRLEIIRLEIIRPEINHTEMTRPEMPLYGYRGAGRANAGGSDCLICVYSRFFIKPSFFRYC